MQGTFLSVKSTVRPDCQFVGSAKKDRRYLDAWADPNHVRRPRCRLAIPFGAFPVSFLAVVPWLLPDGPLRDTTLPLFGPAAPPHIAAIAVIIAVSLAQSPVRSPVRHWQRSRSRCCGVGRPHRAGPGCRRRCAAPSCGAAQPANSDRLHWITAAVGIALGAKSLLPRSSLTRSVPIGRTGLRPPWAGHPRTTVDEWLLEGGPQVCTAPQPLHLSGKAGLHELPIGRRSAFRRSSFAHAVAALERQPLAAVPLSGNLRRRGDAGGHDRLALDRAGEAGNHELPIG